MGKIYQVVIIGGGPAGLAAGIYCARSRLNTLLIEKGVIGGQITNAARVENYPGFPKGISGIDLEQLIPGSQFRKLGVPGEDKLVGRGVSYCATCDGPLFKGKAVAVIGGGDATITEALYLSKFASSVKVVHRRSQLRASKIFQEKAIGEPKIEFI
jgi:thioredoxin reductase (NADPH)